MLTEKELQNLLQKLENKEISADELNRLEAFADNIISQNHQQVFLSEFEKQKIKEQIFEGAKQKLSFEKRSFKPFKLVASIAVFAVIAFAIGFLVYNSQNQFQVFAQTSFGEVKTIQLPDGSEVILNAMSTLEIPNNFNEDYRKVKITGEATFKVSHNKNKPFTVSSNQINTTVLGTTFNLKSYSEDSTTVVSLIEGKVLVTNEFQKINLLPEDQITMHPKSTNAQISAFNKIDVLAWQTKELVLSKTTFKQLKNILYRNHGVEIVFQDKSIAQFTISGRFNNPDLNTILETVCAAKSLKYKETENNQIILY